MAEKTKTISITVEEIKSIQQMRKAIITIKKMKFASPFMLTSVKSPADLRYVRQWMSNFDAQNMQGVVVPLYDAERIMLSLQVDGKQKGLTESASKKIMEDKLIVLDPQLEVAHSKFEPKTKMTSNLPEKYAELFKNRKDIKDMNKEYERFLNYLTENTSQFVSGMLVSQISNRANLLLAPSPLIMNEHPDSLAVSIKINRLTKSICEVNEGWDYAYYFVLRVSDFEDEDTYKAILKVIGEDSPPAVFFKIIDIEYLDSRNSMVQRQNIKDFLKSLRVVTKSKKITSTFLNVDAMGLFLVYSGIDGMSTPVDGIISLRVYGGGKNKNLAPEYRGRYFLYSWMAFIPYRALIKLRKTLGTIPCPNGCCDEYDKLDLKKLGVHEKAQFSRLHYLNTINAYLSELHKGIEEDNARAFENKLKNSSCVNYVDMLPSEAMLPFPIK